MQTRDVTYAHGGKTLTGYLADGSNGKKTPGILVCHQGGVRRDQAGDLRGDPAQQRDLGAGRIVFRQVGDHLEQA